MKKYLFLPGGLMVVGALMWAAFTLRWDKTAIMLGIGGLLALTVAIAANWQNVRDWFRDPRGIFVLNSIFSTLLFVAILGLVNVMAGFWASQADLTAQGRNTLAAETRAGLAGITQDVVLTQFGRSRDTYVDQLLSAFSNASGRLRVAFTDVERSPQEARSFGILRDGSVVVSAAGKWRKVEMPTEAALYEAINQVSQSREPLVCFATGEGERGVDDQGAAGFSLLAAALKAGGYKTERVALQRGPVPASCEALMVGGPSAGLSEEALDRMNAHVGAGGGLALLVDPPVDPNVRAWLALRGVDVGQGVIIETNPAGRQVGSGPESPLALAYFAHDITRGFELATIYDRAAPLHVRESAEIGKPVPLAGTGAGAFERVDLMAQGTEFREGRDRRGPLVLGVASTVRGIKTSKPTGEGRMVMFGDSDFLANASITKQGNRDFALRIVAWLVGEQEARVVSLADRQNRRTSMTEQTRIVMYTINMGLLPLLPLIAGIVQFVRSRR